MQSAPTLGRREVPINVEHGMKWLALATLLIMLGGQSQAQPGDPVPIMPDDLHWSSPPQIPGLRAAWVLGGEHDPGPYLLRVKLAAGARIPPHTHPDTRYSTVLTGTLYVGFGPAFDEARCVAIPAGGVYVAPANVPHFLWAKTGNVEYQEAGTAPTATVPVPIANNGSRTD